MWNSVHLDIKYTVTPTPTHTHTHTHTHIYNIIYNIYVDIVTGVYKSADATLNRKVECIEGWGQGFVSTSRGKGPLTPWGKTACSQLPPSQGCDQSAGQLAHIHLCLCVILLL